MSGCNVFKSGVPSSQSSSVQLLARAYPGKCNLNIAVRLQPGEADQVFSQAEDPDRLAHVEHKRLAAVLHRRGLQDKINASGMVMKNRNMSGA